MTLKIFTDNPLISFRRNKNIQDNLVRSALRQNLQVSQRIVSPAETVPPDTIH